MKKKTSLWIVMPLVLSACATAPTHPALQGGTLPELIPVRDFVADRTLSRVASLRCLT